MRTAGSRRSWCRMSKYRCPQAIIGKARDAIRCKVSGSVCAHQKMCLMEGRIILTDKSLTCPGRENHGGLSDRPPDHLRGNDFDDADVNLDSAGHAAAGVDHQDDVRREEQ